MSLADFVDVVRYGFATLCAVGMFCLLVQITFTKVE